MTSGLDSWRYSYILIQVLSNPMVTTAQTTTPKVGFSEFAEKLEEVKTATTSPVVVQQLPIEETKSTILISVETSIKELVSKLANKEEIGWNTDSDPEDYKHLPNSITGVLVYYLIRGVKEDLGYEFERQPKCLSYNISKFDKKVAGKKRLLTREQKNELLSRTDMSHYDERIKKGAMSIDDAINEIKDAYEKIKEYEEMGYMLPPKKTDYPYWVEENRVNDSEDNKQK